jgi:D-alanyl-D-alanine carboxypeptidase
MKDSQSVQKKQKRFLKKTVKPVIVTTPAKDSLLPKFNFPKLKLRITKKTEKNLALLLIPLILFIIFLLLNAINDYYTREIAKNQLTGFPVETQLSAYPFVNTVPLVALSAKSAIITDSDSQVVLFSKNPGLRFSMASTTKIMTALTALEYYKLNSILTVSHTNVEGSVLRLQLGDQFYFEDLLYAMLLPSANDAAVVIADNYPGGSTAFVARMNEKAKELHLADTHFSDPTGLNDDGDYTTVVDLARLASSAIQNKEFVKITGTKQKIILNVSKTRQYALANLNKLLGTGGVTGIKTGTTEGAGEVLVTSTKSKDHTFIIVVMNSEDRFGDTQALLSFIDQQVQFVNLNGISR